MGFFDLLNPVFDLVDRGLAVIAGPGLRLVLWALVGSLITMLLYKLLSRQEKLSEIKKQIRVAQRELSNFDGEFDEMMPLIRRTIGLSLKQLGLSLGPAFLASIPLIFLLAWAATRFSTYWPAVGEPINITAEVSGDAQLRWRPAAGVTPLESGEWSVQWPDDAVALVDQRGEVIVELPPPAPSPVVHKRQWWNSLFGNPAGYLEPQGVVEAVHLQLPEHEYLPFGPGWLRSWLTAFLVGIFAFSLILKVLLRIH